MNPSPNLLPGLTDLFKRLAKIGIAPRKESKHRKGKTGKRDARAWYRKEKRRRKQAQRDRRFNRRKYSRKYR